MQDLPFKSFFKNASIKYCFKMKILCLALIFVSYFDQIQSYALAPHQTCVRGEHRMTLMIKMLYQRTLNFLCQEILKANWKHASRDDDVQPLSANLCHLLSEIGQRARINNCESMVVDCCNFKAAQ